MGGVPQAADLVEDFYRKKWSSSRTDQSSYKCCLTERSMHHAGLTVLLVAAVAGMCSCQDCALPTNHDLEVVIEGILTSGDSPTPPVINVTSFHPVCLAFSQEQDRYRFVSVVVEYTCTGNTCPSGTAVEQVESQCSVSGMWSNSVQGSTENTRTVNPQASFSTTTREDCAFCLSPERSGTLSTDDVTHCVACHSSCDEGLMRCYGLPATDCCNFYNNSMCVDECPSPFLNNTDHVCVCPVGTTGNNCEEVVDCGSLGNPGNGVVSFTDTTYNSVATYSCNTGYTLTGDDTRTCQSSGLWSGSEPTCTVVDCGALGNPGNGVVSFTATTYNSVATYSCDTGYTLTGDDTRTCQSSGVWSDSEPTCTACSVTNCSLCDADPKICEECRQNYELSENECKCPVSDCSVCDTDTKTCDVCSVEGAKFNEGQSKCIIGGDNSDGGGLCVGAIIGIIIAIIVFAILLALLTVAIIFLLKWYRDHIRLKSTELEAAPSSDHLNPLYVGPDELDDVDKGRVPAGEDGISGGQETGEEVGETAEVNSTDQND